MTSGSSIKVVALGGGHGLASALSALKTITNNLTAIVGVSDNGGSSGRLRSEFNVLPPGDLRMALTALCSNSEHGQKWAKALQHRFPGNGELGGHSIGNLLITALWQQSNDVIAGLDAVCELLEAQGRVLPLSLEPLDIVADVIDRDGKFETVYGQVSVATSTGSITNLKFHQKNAKASFEAIKAIEQSDLIVMGPGSWYTSVVNHLLLEDISHALIESQAKKILITNLTSQSGETEFFTPARHLEVLQEMKPALKFDLVLVDERNASLDFQNVASRIATNVMVEKLTLKDSSDTHDPTRLASAIRKYLKLPMNEEMV